MTFHCGEMRKVNTRKLSLLKELGLVLEKCIFFVIGTMLYGSIMQRQSSLSSLGSLCVGD